jgi:uncharacterized protein (DUF1800 family)
MSSRAQYTNQHLLWRAGFGPNAATVKDIQHASSKQIFNTLLTTSSTLPAPIQVVSNDLEDIYTRFQNGMNPSDLSKEQKKTLRQESREGVKKLNLAWLNEMINNEAQLREKMSLFWHGHFACRIVNFFFQQQLLKVVRQNALGNFGSLLKEISKSPAMISFLNNQQNKKQHPNENFAREVMELFTMGRGNYTENDIKEAARAFTGWGFNPKGEFVNKPFQHDTGSKTFLGKTGNFDGDDILNILLEQKQTARYITKKIYTYFVNEKADNDKIEKLAAGFYQSNYDIKKLLEDIFTSEWFYNESNIGNRIKSPVELLVGIRRLLPMKIENEEVQLVFQKTLGQVLFFPPNVAGWPGGRNWIDSSSLMLRLRVPQIFTNADEFAIKPKDDDDTSMGQGGEMKNKRFQVKTTIDWDSIIKIFQDTKREDIIPVVSNLVLQTTNKVNKELLERYTGKSDRNNYIKTVIVQLMSTPEYQLC